MPEKVGSGADSVEDTGEGLSLLRWIWVMVLVWIAAGVPLDVLAAVAWVGAVLALAAAELILGVWAVATVVAASRGTDLLHEHVPNRSYEL